MAVPRSVLCFFMSSPLLNQGVQYIYLKTCLSGGTYVLCMDVWRNDDVGGAHLKGDGVFYADMRGLGKGDDYVWISPDGQGIFHGNQHKWDPSNWIIGSTDLFNGKLGDRRGIRLADIDADGKADVVLLDQYTGTMTWKKTSYSPSTGFTFTNMGAISGPSCSEGWGGVGLRDLAVRFADLE